MMPELQPAYAGTDPYVFISYSHADEERVHAELRWLQDQGIRVWYDATGISAGAEWNEEIARAIKGASCFLYFVTPRSVASEHCRRELSFAQSHTPQLLAVHLEETTLPDGLRLSLENRQAVLCYRMTRSDYEVTLKAALSGAGQKPTLGAPMGRPATTAAPAARWRATAIAGVLAMVVAVAGSWLWRANHQAPAATQRSIAVLPFVDMSPAQDQQHIGDGISEEILNRLTRLDGLRVAARTSSFAFRDRKDGLQAIGDALRVNTILDGSVRRNEGRLRITAQLINAADGYHLWSETYDRQLDDIFTIQADIAKAVAGALGVTLGVGDINAFEGAGTSNIEAYEAFHEARSRPTAERIRLLERAVTLDPEYAAAWGELGRSVASTMWESAPQEAPAIIDEATPHLMKAVELDPGSSRAYAMLATVTYARFEWARSEEYFQKAMALSPDAEALGNYANMLMRAGRSSDAIEAYEAQTRAAEESLPADFPANGLAFSAYVALEQFARARALAGRLEPGRQPGFDYLVRLNDGDSAQLEEFLATTPPPEGTLLATVAQQIREPANVVTALEAALDDPTVWPSKYHDIALLAAFFGDPELALRSISVEARLTAVRFGALWYPVMREVRRLPAFSQLLEDLRLPAYWRDYGWPDHCRPQGETVACD